MENNYSLRDKMNFVLGLLYFPALTVMVFLRKKVGFRRLKPWILVLLAAALIILPEFTPTSLFLGRSTGFAALRLFAVAMLVLGILQRRERWNAIRQGVQWHTMSPGVSRLAGITGLRTDIVFRFVDPGVTIIAGYILWKIPFTYPLGAWLMFSGWALFMVEQAMYDMQLERVLDQLDGLVESDIHAENVKFFQGEQPAEVQQEERSLEDTAGIPTGVGADIEEQIQRRKKRTPPPDDLA